MKALLTSVVLSTLVFCSHEHKPRLEPVVDDALGRIERLEESRRLSDGKVELVETIVYGRSVDLRTRSLLALARLQDEAQLSHVLRSVPDLDPQVRHMAAFGAQELALPWHPVSKRDEDAIATSLLAQESLEENASVRRVQLSALGATATTLALIRLAARVEDSDPEVAEAALLSLGSAVRRGAPLPSSALGPIAQLAERAPSTHLRWAATYVFASAKSEAGRAALESAAKDPDAEVRAVAAKGLGGLALSTRLAPSALATLRSLLGDAHGPVASEAVSALARSAARCAGSEPCAAVEALEGVEERVTRLAEGDVAGGAMPLLALAQAGLPAAHLRLLETLRQRLKDAFDRAGPATRPDLASLDCRFAAALDGARGELREVQGCGMGQVAEARRLRLGLDALSRTTVEKTQARALPLIALLSHESPVVRLGAIEALEAWKRPENAQALRPFLNAEDRVVAAAAAEALGALGDSESGPAVLARARDILATPELAQPYADALTALRPEGFRDVLKAWLGFPHANVRAEAARALSAVDGQLVIPKFVPGMTPFPAAPRVPQGTRLELVTLRGRIVIALDPGLAPLTTAELVRLARQGFYKGLTFHRIVPDFVAQGGDPHGDGEGGPGFTLPCEVSSHPYVRGTVGMALGGKDTGGSQFFITLSRQPHLDGRYTVIGQVESGLEVADTLLEGDVISRVVVRAGGGT